MVAALSLSEGGLSRKIERNKFREQYNRPSVDSPEELCECARERTQSGNPQPKPERILAKGSHPVS
jgi:hypothetical protein